MPFAPASPDNEAIREIRDSSKRLEKLTEKFAISTEQLSKSSERLELFTLALIGITVFLAVIAVVELLKDFISEFVVYILAFAFLAVIAEIIYILTKIGKVLIPQK